MNRRDLLTAAGGLVALFSCSSVKLKAAFATKEETNFPTELSVLIGSHVELLDEEGCTLLTRNVLCNRFESPTSVEQRAVWEIGTKMTIFPVAVAIYRPDGSIVRVAKIPSPTILNFYDTKYPDSLTIVTRAIFSNL